MIGYIDIVNLHLTYKFSKSSVFLIHIKCKDAKLQFSVDRRPTLMCFQTLKQTRKMGEKRKMLERSGDRTIKREIVRRQRMMERV